MMKKLIFGITSLTIGGAERVLVDLVNNVCDKYDTTIITIYSNGKLEEQLSDKIKIKSIYSKSYNDLSKIRKTIATLKVLLFRKQIYNKYIRNSGKNCSYDTEIAFLEGPITRLFSVKNNYTKKIAWIHNDTYISLKKGIKNKIKKHIDSKIYTKYNTIVFVSKDSKEKFEKVYKNLKNKQGKDIEIKVIYNYIDSKRTISLSNIDNDIEKEIKLDDNQINFLTVARLVEDKAIDRIIRVHSKLIKEGFNHRFYVIGDGPLKKELENCIKKYDVEDTFILLGEKTNPYPYIKRVEYFCLLSKAEGYGMVIEEAKILDKKILITDTGAREAVAGYKKSMIFDNEEQSIYEGLKKIVAEKVNIEYRKDIEVKQNKENNKELYDNSNIINEIIDLVGE